MQWGYGGMKYPLIESNQWVSPIKKGYRMRCCDCGLVHELDFKHVPYGSGRKILIRARRHERATSAVRAWMRRANA